MQIFSSFLVWVLLASGLVCMLLAQLPSRTRQQRLTISPSIHFVSFAKRNERKAKLISRRQKKGGIKRMDGDEITLVLFEESRADQSNVTTPFITPTSACKEEGEEKFLRRIPASLTHTQKFGREDVSTGSNRILDRPPAFAGWAQGLIFPIRRNFDMFTRRRNSICTLA